jgi:hypothetical protein
MTYDPHTGAFGDFPLFDTGNDADPFAIPTDDVQDDGTDGDSEWSKPAGDIPSGQIGNITYDRGDNEIVGRPTSLDRNDGAWTPRVTPDERRNLEESADRSRTDTGNRNVRRAARQHEGSSREREEGDRTLATSLTDAAAKLRRSVTGNERTYDPDTATLGVDRGVDHFIKTVAAGSKPTHLDPESSTTFTHRQVHEVATFQEVDFECELYAAKMNAAGDWLVTFKLPFSYRSVVTELSAAAGMNLRTNMKLDGFAQ